MKKIFIISIMFLSIVTMAQNKKQLDRESIKAMAGCYKVTFNFAETFSPDPNYQKHNNYQSWSYELAKIITDEPNRIDIQHLLVVGDEGNEYVIKHWRQDWTYENPTLYNFEKFDQERKVYSWSKANLSKVDVIGQWTQKVYQVDDSPRYEGRGTWVHYDGKHYWESITDAPLPRREYSNRSDYNVLVRKNRQEIVENGWVHEQDNAKVLRTAGTEKIIAYEKGWNTYEKVDAKHCELAEQWWEENQEIWKRVRNTWEDKFNNTHHLVLKTKVDNKPMYEDFFNLKRDATKEEIEDIINKYSIQD